MSLATSLSAFAQERAPLCPSSKAVILVGGIFSDWKYFEPWLPDILAENDCVFGFTLDHTNASMSANAARLKSDLDALQKEGVTGVLVLAHSMGGLVARKAVLAHAEGASKEPLAVDLHAYGTPWGGFFWSNLVKWTPGLDTVLTWMGLPMTTEIGSKAAFMNEFKNPLPTSVRMVIHQGIADGTAAPEEGTEAEQYLLATGGASKVVYYSGVGHNDYTHKLDFETVRRHRAAAAVQ